MKVLALGTVAAGFSTFAASLFVLSRIPICGPPPPPGDVVLDCVVHDFASVLAPLGMLIALIGSGLLCSLRVALRNRDALQFMERLISTIIIRKIRIPACYLPLVGSPLLD